MTIFNVKNSKIFFLSIIIASAIGFLIFNISKSKAQEESMDFTSYTTDDTSGNSYYDASYTPDPADYYTGDRTTDQADYYTGDPNDYRLDPNSGTGAAGGTDDPADYYTGDPNDYRTNTDPADPNTNTNPDTNTDNNDFTYDDCVASGDSPANCCTFPKAPDNCGKDLSCDASASCMFYNCCPKESGTAKVPTAAEKKAAEQLSAKANSAAAAQNNAANNVNQANAALSSCGAADSQKCADAKAAADKANAELAEANTKLAEAQAAAAEANAKLNGNNAANNSSGSGLYMSANGMLGTVVGQGSYGSYNAGLGGSYTSPGSVAGLAGGACGAGFSAIGGVCFPTTTGLSAAPISVILSNVFSWLMGLFTTFAVIAFVISGIQYFTSAGDEGQIETAKRNAMYAILGVVIGLSGFVIVKAIAGALSGQSYFF